MRKFKFVLRVINPATGVEEVEIITVRAWFYRGAVTKAMWRGQNYLRYHDDHDKNLYFRVCKFQR